jgi:hypothetical protein
MGTPDELLEVVELLIDIRDTQLRVAYSTRQAGLQLGGVSESFIRAKVREGVIAKVPHMGSRVLIPHAELVRLAGSHTLAGGDGARADLRLA